MESIEQPFDSLGRMHLDESSTDDKLELIDENTGTKRAANGSSPEAENSPLHHNKTTNSILHGPQNHGLRVIILSSIVFALAVTVALILTIFLEPKQIHGHAAVTCEDSRCSDQGLHILRQGGNSVDAAVATAFCLAVVNPAHAGIGGGGFALVHDHKFHNSWGFNFREQAPDAITPEMRSQPGFEKSILSVGIPGFVKGLHQMHHQLGVLPWKDLIDPAIELAERGVAVSIELASILEKQELADFQVEPLRSTFLTKDGAFKTVNDTYTLPILAYTLAAIREQPDSLYSGSLRDNFVADISRENGIITADDMSNYEVKSVDIVSSKLKDLTVTGLSAPAGGVEVALMLNIVDKLSWKKDQKQSDITYHQLIESYKFGYAHRSLLGDPSTEAGMGSTVSALIAPEFAESLVKRIDNNRTYDDPAHYGSSTLLSTPDKGTSHISVIDSAEMMVSVTLSINDYFGSKKMTQQTGIVLNNELNDFDKNSSSPNGMAPGKRPLSSMAPTVITNEEHPCNRRMIVGGQGGMMITTAVVETVVNAVMFKMNISAAVSAPRVHNQLDPPETLYEPGIKSEILTALEAKGHVMKQHPATTTSAKVLAIEKINDNVHALNDFRAHGGPGAQF